MAMLVSTRVRPQAGMVTSTALYKSWPAECWLPFVGAVALSDRSCTSKDADMAGGANEAEMGGRATDDIACGVGVPAPLSVR